MKRLRAFLIAAVGILALSCASVDSRIAKSQDVFDGYPPEVQAKIRAGEIGVGFSEEQVRMALGEPSRRTQVTSEDAVGEVWTWSRSVPGIGIGFGTGSRIGRVGMGTGISVGEGSRSEDEMVVELVNGRVTRFEKLLED